MTGPDKRFSLDVAHQVGLTLERYESGSDRTAPSLDDETQQGNSSQPAVVRSAGPEAMRDAPARWEKVDESIDESFPASDPPANNRFD